MAVKKPKVKAAANKDNDGNDDDAHNKNNPNKKSKNKEKKPAAAPQDTGACSDGDEDAFSDMRGLKKKKRKMIDGLRIYTYDELGIRADSGGTAQCPFDCECCF